jgi:hypothetical protein
MRNLTWYSAWELIEHFPEDQIDKAVKAHFDLLADNGIVIITFPTPTFLYELTRFFSDLLGIWIFHDEVPIRMGEGRRRVEKFGHVLYSKINWPIFLTQGIIAARVSDKI